MVAKDINQKLVIFDKSLKTDYQTTYQLTTQLARTARQSLALPRIDKNASDRAAIINPDGFPPGFKSTSRAEFHPDASALCATYKRERPAFDRVSSCKTNYSLGKAPFEAHTTHGAEFAHPRQQPRAAQAEIGGWKHADGSYKLDNAAIVSLRRGGGGGEGALGVRFDLITGEAIPGCRSARRAIAGARRTLNMTAVPTGEFYNVATNRVADPGAVPGRDTPGRLRRRNDTAHRTRPYGARV